MMPTQHIPIKKVEPARRSIFARAVCKAFYAR